MIYALLSGRLRSLSVGDRAIRGRCEWSFACRGKKNSQGRPWPPPDRSPALILAWRLRCTAPRSSGAGARPAARSCQSS